MSSGKTTLACALADSLGWPHVSFGDYVRREAMKLGLGESREALQELGASLVQDSNRFCQAVLNRLPWEPGQHLIVDGIRHSEVLGSLRDITKPSNLHLVFVDVDNQTRMLRYFEGKNVDKEKFCELETHSTEVQVKATLRAVAGLVLDGSLPKEDLVNHMTTWIQSTLVFFSYRKADKSATFSSY